MAEHAPAPHLGIRLVLGTFLVLLALSALVVWRVAASQQGSRTMSYVGPVTASAAPVVATRPPVRPSRGGSGSRLPVVSSAWVDSTAAKAGIPATAVLAYARAQLVAPCRIGWTTIAAIGWVESRHGTLGGRTLGTDGRSTPRIVGPQLSGGLDHAYGPMQFIPDTWARYAADGDGDGRADIDDLFDAARATAAYLCADGYDLTTGSGWAQAVFSYNHAQEYVDAVYAAATAYDERTR